MQNITETLFQTASIGQILLILSICVCALQVFAFALPVANFTKNICQKKLSYFNFALTSAAYILLTYFYVTSNFTISNVFENSHTAKPLFYKIAGVWGNHEGSMLLFLFIITIFNFVFALKAQKNEYFSNRVLGFQSVICLLIGVYIYFTSNPFDLSPILEGQFPVQGKGLNPLLQDFGLAIHPPTLYIGYVGFSLAFSGAIAALANPQDEALFAQFVKSSKPYVLFSFAFLTLGVALGSWWAYRELGWGGFWFWDPVENSSLMPWLAGLALLHSILVVDKRKTMKGWVVFFSMLAFTLSLVGFFLVRSGILSSVHSFAADPTRGVFMLAILAIITVYGFSKFAVGAGLVKNYNFYKIISREGEISISNILIIALIGTIMLGVFYPLILDMFIGKKLSVGEPYFNLTFVPIAIFSLFLASFGPYTKWQSDNLWQVFKSIKFSFLAALIITAVIAYFYHEQKDIIDYFALVCSFFLAATMVQRLHLKITQSGKISSGFLAMFFSHIGIAVVAIAITLLTMFQSEKDFIVKAGDTVKNGQYEIEFKGSKITMMQNYITNMGEFEVRSNGKNIGTLKPENRVYFPSMQKTAEADILYLTFADLYLVLGQPEGVKEQGVFAIKLYIKPFMSFIWVGAILIFIGGLIGMIERKKK
jgi:cytochrome c-type biogenesis protein CcmF